MSYNKLSTYKTKITRTNDISFVTYHNTRIVTWQSDKITLQSNGWQGVTTKRKMNQTSHQFGLGFSVWQKNHVWYVAMPDGQTCEYEDGMSFGR